jgi:hypothetical protein
MIRMIRIVVAAAIALAAVPFAQAQQCPPTTPVEGAPPPAPLPVFPADNWWNLDISAAPVDTGSGGYIAFINNGGTRHLHPDFGGEVSPGSTDIYGFPYAIVDGFQPKQAVTFQYFDESDGVDANGQGVPFYPIPSQAITQTHWVEGGAPANVDQRSSADRHLLMIDCTNRYLYELYNVYYNGTQGKWYGGSGAFFDLNTNNRRPDGWTSADAAGLAIFPGLVRYDDAWNPAVTDIGHAFRVTVRATNGYVFPASHQAGSTQDQCRRLRSRHPHHRSERAEDFPCDAEVRPDRGRQRQRHVHQRHLRHALEQRHPQSRVLDPDCERLRGSAARLESAAVGSRGIERDQREPQSGRGRQFLHRYRHAFRRCAERWRLGLALKREPRDHAAGQRDGGAGKYRRLVPDHYIGRHHGDDSNAICDL